MAVRCAALGLANDEHATAEVADPVVTTSSPQGCGDGTCTLCCPLRLLRRVRRVPASYRRAGLNCSATETSGRPATPIASAEERSQVDPADRYFQSSCPCGYTFLPSPTPSDDRGDVSVSRDDHDRSEALAVSEREGGDVAIGYPSVVSHLIASVPVRGGATWSGRRPHTNMTGRLSTRRY